jgi:hypothetical protein
MRSLSPSVNHNRQSPAHTVGAAARLAIKKSVRTQRPVRTDDHANNLDMDG